MPRIRPADVRDGEALRRLFEVLTGHPVSVDDVDDRLRMVAASPIDEVYVLEDDSTDGDAREPCIQGLLAFRIRENVEERSRYGEIAAIVTHPEAQGRGYGTALMTFAEQLARERGCKGTWLVSGFGREESAHQFYRHLGYTPTGLRFVKPLDQA